MMRSRHRARPRASTPQYRPEHLLYRRAAGSGDFDWHGCSLDQVAARIRTCIPARLAGDYARLQRGGLSATAERALGPLLDWLDTEARALGFRVPTSAERARATGQGEYLRSLGLTEVGLYDAVGNHFDCDAVVARMVGPLSEALQRGSGQRHRYPPPAELAAVYRELAQEVRGERVPVQTSPFPADVRDALTAMCPAREDERERTGTPGEGGGEESCPGYSRAAGAETGRRMGTSAAGPGRGPE